MPRIKTKASDGTLLANQTNAADISKDSVDTNRPQAEEKDLQDLLKDIEEQYEEEESKRKRSRKKKNKRVEEDVTVADDEKKEEPKPAEDNEAVKEKRVKKQEKQKTKTKDVPKIDKPKEGKKVEKPKETKKPDKPKDQVDIDKPKDATEKEQTAKDSESKTKSSDVHAEKAADRSEKSSKQASKAKKKPGGATAKQLEIIKQTLARQKELEEQLAREEEERIKREEELERIKEAKLEEERQRKLRRKEKQKARIQKKKELGLYLTKEQKEKKDRALRQLELAGVLPVVGDTERRPSAPRKSKRQSHKIEEKEEPQEDILQEEEKETPSVDGTVSSDDGVKQCWDDETDEETTLPAKAVSKEDNAKKVVDDNSSSDEYDESSSEYEEESEDDAISSLPPEQRARARINRRHEIAQSRINLNDLRCPVICVMGHVDTGKTKMLDNLRRTHVQDGEAGGITQQIGATNVPQETIVERTKHCFQGRIEVPGFMFIDTPGHESFKNLRVRGSSLCDIAILIVDLMHGIEPQTIESLQLLRSRRCPFVVALNKVDRLNGWKSGPGIPIEKLINEKQEVHTKNEFERRYKQVIVELAQQKVNAALFYQNPDAKSFYPMVPVSAVTGDGVGDLMAALVEVCQDALREKIAFSEELKCTVMEVKSIEGFGTTIDICLVNGRIHVGDTIVVPGQDGPLVTQIRGLLMPAHNKDLRVKNQYQIYKEVKGARGVKIAAKGLERAMAGLPLYVAEKEDEIEVFQDELRTQLKSVLSSFATQDVGVYVQASTLGSLEALLAFLNTSKIPFSGINIGPVHRMDVTRASVMLEKDSQWAVILAFDVRVEREAQEVADSNGVKIFTADIIYHLFDKFMAYRDELKAQNKEKHRHAAVFPCMVKILPQYVFNSRDPIVVGVNIERGFVKMGTPLCVIKDDEEPLDIGRVSSIEFNHKAIDVARAGDEVCLKIEAIPGEAPKMIGRHFEVSDPLYSKISRDSIDVVKEYFRDEMQKADWQLIIDLKNKLKII